MNTTLLIISKKEPYQIKRKPRVFAPGFSFALREFLVVRNMDFSPTFTVLQVVPSIAFKIFRHMAK